MNAGREMYETGMWQKVSYITGECEHNTKRKVERNEGKVNRLKRERWIMYCMRNLM